MSTVRWIGEVLRADRLRPDRRAVEHDQQVEAPVLGRPGRAHPPVVLQEAALELRARDGRPGDAERHLAGRVDAGLREPARSSSELVIGRQAQAQALGPESQAEERPGVCRGSVRASMGARRYTPPMGAVETMEDFFEKLNAGDREAAVALMDEKTEMRVHVGDSVQTLRGVERVGGWFLRGEKGLRMIPGEIRDTGNT